MFSANPLQMKEKHIRNIDYSGKINNSCSFRRWNRIKNCKFQELNNFCEHWVQEKSLCVIAKKSLLRWITNRQHAWHIFQRIISTATNSIFEFQRCIYSLQTIKTHNFERNARVVTQAMIKYNKKEREREKNYVHFPWRAIEFQLKSMKKDTNEDEKKPVELYLQKQKQIIFLLLH